MRRVALTICGVLMIATAGLHVAFWPALGWAEELQAITPVSSGILQVLNICFIAVLVWFAGMSFYLAKRPTLHGFQRSVLVFLAFLFLLRGALEGPFFGWGVDAFVTMVLCALTSVAYLAAMRDPRAKPLKALAPSRG